MPKAPLPAPPWQLPTRRIWRDRRDSDRERVGKATGAWVYKVRPLFSSFFLPANTLSHPLAPLAWKTRHTGVFSCSTTVPAAHLPQLRFPERCFAFSDPAPLLSPCRVPNQQSPPPTVPPPMRPNREARPYGRACVFHVPRPQIMPSTCKHRKQALMGACFLCSRGPGCLLIPSCWTRKTCRDRRVLHVQHLPLPPRHIKHADTGVFHMSRWVHPSCFSPPPFEHQKCATQGVFLVFPYLFVSRHDKHALMRALFVSSHCSLPSNTKACPSGHVFSLWREGMPSSTNPEHCNVPGTAHFNVWLPPSLFHVPILLSTLPTYYRYWLLFF